MSAKILNIRDIKDICYELICDYGISNWKILIYSFPPRVVIECNECGGVGEMPIDPIVEE